MNQTQVAVSAGFRPAMPEMAPSGIGAMEALRRARRNVISVFERRAYFAPFFARRYVNRASYFCNSPETIRHVLVANADNYVKSRAMQRSLRPLMGSGMLITNGAEWKAQRERANPLFSPKRLREFARIKSEEAGALVERWSRRRPDDEFDMAVETTDATARVVSRAMFSIELGRDSEVVLNASTRYQSALCHVDYAEMLGLPSWMGGRVSRKMRRAVRQVDEVVFRLIRDRLGGDDRGDFISVLVASEIEKNDGKVDVRAVRDQVTVMLLAGHETTANLLAWTLYLISQDKGVAERLHEEAAAAIGAGPARLDDIAALPFTVAVLEETLRLYPSIPVLWRNAVDADDICGNPVEAGSNVIISPWLIHRNRAYWQQANRFVPERMLKENRVGRDRFLFIPFGAGPRVCIGANFAMHEATIMLSTIMANFRVRLREGFQPEPLARFTLRPHPGLPMTVERW